MSRCNRMHKLIHTNTKGHIYVRFNPSTYMFPKQFSWKSSAYKEAIPSTANKQ